MKNCPSATHSSFRPQRRLVGLPNLVRVSLTSWYSLSARALGTPSQAKMRIMIIALAQWWPARWRTRQSSFSFSQLRRITWHGVENLILPLTTKTDISLILQIFQIWGSYFCSYFIWPADVQHTKIFKMYRCIKYNTCTEYVLLLWMNTNPNSVRIDTLNSLFSALCVQYVVLTP